MKSEIALARYIKEKADIPFVWGQHDCLTFAAGCIYAQTGETPLADMLGDYGCPVTAMMHARKRIKQMDYPSDVLIIDALDDRLKRLDGPYPPRGSITARKVDQELSVTGWMLGVTLRRHSAFLGPDAMVFVEREPGDLYWSVG
tara:strand:+ start:589 stop:1020 length:432 start_codon:yes stop_codon:yes gene_type:complete